MRIDQTHRPWLVGTVLGFLAITAAYVVYAVRTPGGPLFELAVSKPEGWAIDEAADALGREFVLPPWLEDRRAEMLGRLEHIDTGVTA